MNLVMAETLVLGVWVFEFQILTFLHHIQSFQDAAGIVSNGPNPYDEIDATVLEQILTNSEEETVESEAHVAFRSYLRPLPERIEVALMNDRHQSYGLLLEQPALLVLLLRIGIGLS